MSTMTTLSRWEDEVFTFTKKVETPVVRYTGEMADNVAKYVPTRPSFMAKMPTMGEMVEHGLKLRKRMVDEQALFVRKMMKAMDPVFAKFETAPKPHKVEHVVKPVARMTPRKPVRKVA